MIVTKVSHAIHDMYSSSFLLLEKDISISNMNCSRKPTTQGGLFSGALAVMASTLRSTKCISLQVTNLYIPCICIIVCQES